MLRSNKIISSKNFQLKMLLILFLFSFSKSWGQTNPTAQSLPYTWSGGSSLPAGMAVHSFSALLTTRSTANATGNLGTGSGTTGGYDFEGTGGADGISMLGSGSVNAGAVVVSVITTNTCNINVSYIAWTQSNNRACNVALQYRVGTSGTWIDVNNPTSSVYTSNASTGRSNGVSFNQNLPIAAENQSVVQIRWVYWDSGSSGSRSRIGIDQISITGGACSACTSPATTITPTTQTVCAGAVTNISVSSSAASNTYTWQASATSGGVYSNVSNSTPAGTSYSGANTAVLTLTAGTTYYYRCLVTDVTGSCTATSGTSTLVVNTVPSVTTPTISNATSCEGSTNTTVKINASGSTSLSYQWQVSTGSGYSNVSGAAYTGGTTNTLTIGNSITAGTYSFQCIVTNACGSTTSAVSAHTVVVIPVAPPTPSIMATCNTAVISETVIGVPPAGVTWYWASNANAPVSFTSAVNDYSATSSGTVYIRAKSDIGTCWNSTVTTNSVVVTVIKSPTIATQPTSSLICQGNTASIKVTMSASSTAPFTYQWQENTGSGFANISSGSPYAISVGTYTSTLGIDGTKPIGTYTYQCIISNSCGTVTTSIVTVTITATPANDLCSNGSPIVIDAAPIIGNLNCASPTAGLAYNPSKNDVWYVFTPTCTASHTVTMTFTTSGADYDVDLFTTGSCPTSGAAVYVAHGSSTTETITQTLTSGVTYYLRVLDYNTSGGTFSVGVASNCGTPHTVTFDANGGSGTMSNQTSGSATNLTINAFTNSGCFFVAWNTAADGSGTTYANGAVYSFTADITLYAQWNCSGGSSFSCTGAVGNGKTQGCGDSNPCNLSTIGTYLDGVACNTTLSASCTGGCDVQTSFSRLFIVPAGCTATVVAEMKVRSTGCGNSGMDSGDQLAITNSGGSVISQTATLSNGGTISGSSINKNSGIGNSDGWVQMIITGGVVTVSGSGQRGDEIVTYTLNFSGTCGSDCYTILPITLLDFHGIKNNDINELMWEVAEEENIKRYVIEKSRDGVNFEHMIGVYPSEGHINKTYRVEDLNPYNEITYYRLGTMENDYSVQYYKTISLDNNHWKDWSYYYNQLNNNLIIEFKNAIPKNAQVVVFDLSGQQIEERNIEQSQTKINTDNLSTGIYFVRITSPYKIENFKIIIQK